MTDDSDADGDDLNDLIDDRPAKPWDLLLDNIRKAIPDAPVFGLSNQIKTSIKKHDGSYRTRPFMSGQEFVLKDVYRGKRDLLVLQFEPIEANSEFELMELTEKNAGEVMAEAIEFLETAIAAKPGSWKTAKAAFLKAGKEDAKRKAETAEANKYKDNPMWGMF